MSLNLDPIKARLVVLNLASGLHQAAHDFSANATTDLRALVAEVERLRAEASAAFGEQMRAEGERDAARRELAEIRTALGDLVNAGGNKGLPETVAGLAEYAMRTSDRLIEVSDERDKLRETVAVYEAGGEWPADLGAPLQCGTLGAVTDPLPEKAKT